MHVVAVGRPEVPPLEMPARFRMEIVYFMTVPGEHGAPAKLAEGEYWIDPAEAKTWLDDLVICIVSPLDAASKAEIPLTDDHEAWLQWVVDHNVQHMKLV
ncbi:hypothetical protein NA78x_004712 [Anatilimnocola sp. NA78]|uniref:hypothetical protein n=1 Tax=Anatilimnocola sp. NA78 TaxID=3415683 RepID=UPI003CE4B33F